MQAHQRKRHRLLWVVLTGGLAIALIIAFSSRDEVRSLLRPESETAPSNPGP